MDCARLLGIQLHRVNLRQAMAKISEVCRTRRPLHVVTVNMNFFTIARSNPAFAGVINNAGLTVADGRIVLWMTRLLGEPAPEQITGHDLFRECIAMAAARRYGVFLLGGAPGDARGIADRLAAAHPSLRIIGTDHGRFSADGHAERQEELEAEIREFRPDFLFVAIGCPKQELWIANHLPRLQVPVAIGVGSVFDVENGTIRRAPRWMQVAGLESVFKVIVAPRRYAGRYLRDDPPTLVLMLWEIVKRRLSR